VNQKRKNERVHVDLPVTCNLEGGASRRQLRGRIKDLSISGIQLDLPLTAQELGTELVDFELDLPRPFSRIKATGEVQWKRWDEGRGATTCGLKLEPLSLKHLQEIDTIVREVADGGSKRTK
jgi:c-di-GMP-binding flagellar brake protein YcgR